MYIYIYDLSVMHLNYVKFSNYIIHPEFTSKFNGKSIAMSDVCWHTQHRLKQTSPMQVLDPSSFIPSDTIPPGVQLLEWRSWPSWPWAVTHSLAWLSLGAMGPEVRWSQPFFGSETGWELWPVHQVGWGIGWRIWCNGWRECWRCVARGQSQVRPNGARYSTKITKGYHCWTVWSSTLSPNLRNLVGRHCKKLWDWWESKVLPRLWCHQ